MDKRSVSQLLATIITNANINGFIEKNIYKGYLKKVCVPGLNCYSCPGAIGSCPIGAMQAVIGSITYNISLYVIGFISLLGILFGRLICGWLCPFGFFQDLLYKLSARSIKVNKKINHLLNYAKYVILLVFVILLPMFWVNEFGIGAPYFCEYICPAGTLEGGIPLVLWKESLRDTIGFLFAWKMFILIGIVIASIVIYRPFCRYVCPLGALYGLFNPISFYNYRIDKNKCTNCHKCVRRCQLDIDIYKNPNSPECIRCGNCIKACPTKALTRGISI